MSESLYIQKKLFVRLAQDNQEYEKDAAATVEYLKQLRERGVDIYTFLERTWCSPIKNPPENWKRSDDNVGMLEVTTLDAWFTVVGKKTRNMIRKAEKNDVKVSVDELTPQLVEGIWKIYNETPIRQGRAFSHYGQSLQSVADNMKQAKNATFIGFLPRRRTSWLYPNHLRRPHRRHLADSFFAEILGQKSQQRTFSESRRSLRCQWQPLAHVWPHRQSSLTRQI